MYDAFMRDASDHSLTASTRVRAAFDALYTACLQLVDTQDLSADSGEKFAETVVARALAAMNLPGEEASLVSKLAGWVLHVAPLGPLPMSPEEAVALAERVHDILGDN